MSLSLRPSADLRHRFVLTTPLPRGVCARARGCVRARMCVCTHATSSLFVFCVTTGYQIQVQSASDFLLFHELSRLGYPQSRHGFKVFFHFLSHPLALSLALSHTLARARARARAHSLSLLLSLAFSLPLPLPLPSLSPFLLCSLSPPCAAYLLFHRHPLPSILPLPSHSTPSRCART